VDDRRSVGDVGVAEDIAQEALFAPLEQWPETGVPRNPAAWLMAVGKRSGAPSGSDEAGSQPSSGRTSPCQVGLTGSS